MGLFLHVVGSVSPTEPTEEGNLLHCEGLNNHSYVCESGHCCGESKCCNYYELWWFWLVWAVIVILSCCCICHHRRTKHRLQQQQRQHEINLIAYREAHNYTSVPFYFRFLPNYLLPDYEEVVNRPPTPPPPYSALHTVPTSPDSSPLSSEQQEGRCPAIQSTPVPPVSNTLCSRPSLEELDLSSRGFRPKLENKPLHTAQKPGTITRLDTLQDGLAREGRGSLEKRDGGGGGGGGGGDDNGDDSCKDPLLKDLGGSELSAEDKERLPGGRRRRFTGDSGIEVCVCGPRGNGGCSGAGALEEGKELRELESLLGCEEGADFCDSCGPRAQLGDEEKETLGGPEGQHSGELADEPLTAPLTSSASPVCLLLHTINEQEGPHSGSGSGTEPEG